MRTLGKMYDVEFFISLFSLVVLFVRCCLACIYFSFGDKGWVGGGYVQYLDS